VSSEVFENAVRASLDESALSDRHTLRAFNGFGQPVWEWVGTVVGGKYEPVSARMVSYAPTGETLSSWTGTSANVTAYAYVRDPSISGFGQPRSVAQLHGEAMFTYDGFGRVVSRRNDGEFVTSFRYDTLDRVVGEVRPDGGETHSHYHPSGEAERTIVVDPLAATGPVEIVTSMELDAFGRALTTVLPDTTPGVADDNTVLTAFDPFDRPIAVTDNRLSTLTDSSAHRTSYFAYDARGNLVRQLGPALRTKATGGAYTDASRPYVEVSYDGFGRATQERRLLAANSIRVTRDNFFTVRLPGRSNPAVAVTDTEYDGFGCPIRIIDPEGYLTTSDYDPAGNPVEDTQQVFRESDPVLSRLPNGYAVGARVISNETAYDAAGRALATRDPRGGTTSTRYDLLGNVLSQTDARGVTVVSNTYTADGLLVTIKEPHPQTGTLVATKHYRYEGRRFPSEMRSAAMGTAAGAASGALTTYAYDFAGRTTASTLPATADHANAVVRQHYDTRGNLTRLIDANGFETRYAHDLEGRVTRETKLPRSEGIDQRSGAGGSALTFTSSYSYDAAGNLVREERGAPGSSDALITDYLYNTLGSVVAESRPHTPAGPVRYRLTTYRLDGQVTGRTTYDHAGGLRNQSESMVAGLGPSNYPDVLGGNLTVSAYDRKGQLVREVSLAGGSGAPLREHSVRLFRDGLGRQVKREFDGDRSVYAAMRDTAGNARSPRYDSFWRYDANGNLLETRDALPGDSAKQNRFTYTYSATNRELTSTRNVVIRVPAPRGSQSTSPFRGGVLLAATRGSTSVTYNHGDLPASTTVVDETSYRHYGVQESTRVTTSYSYYLDGSLRRTDVDDNGTTGFRTFVYDARGREVEQIDSNGESTYRRDNDSVIGARRRAVISTRYFSSGVSTQWWRPTMGSAPGSRPLRPWVG
jgi:YD repeat-containing protein